MKAISIKNPWATLFITGDKDIEVRTWAPKYRGDLLLCSSANPKIEGTIPGHALTVCTLQDVEPLREEHLEAAYMAEMPDRKSYAWILTDFRGIKPFPVKGKLNFFEVDDSLIEYIDGDDKTDEEVVEAVNKYIEPLVYHGKKRGQK